MYHSRILLATQTMDIARKMLVSEWDPDLWVAVIMEIFHWFEN